VAAAFRHARAGLASRRYESGPDVALGGIEDSRAAGCHATPPPCTGRGVRGPSHVIQDWVMSLRSADWRFTSVPVICDRPCYPEARMYDREGYYSPASARSL
jgi:hypothetical protein